MLCYHWISALPLTDVFPGPKGKAPACLLHPRIYSPCPTAEPSPTHGRTGKGPCPCRPLSLYRAVSCLILPIDAGKAGSASGLRIRGSDSSEGTCGKWPRFIGNWAVNQREHSCSRVRQEPACLAARLPRADPCRSRGPCLSPGASFPVHSTAVGRASEEQDPLMLPMFGGGRNIHQSFAVCSGIRASGSG